jgi:hypothetical protein
VDRILEVLPDPDAPGKEDDQVAQEAGIPLLATREALGTLVDQGRATRTGNGVKGDPYLYRRAGALLS